MQKDIQNIKLLCDTHRTAPKLLLIPSRRMKAQIFKMLGDYGVPTLNLFAMTIRELAHHVARHKISQSGVLLLDVREVTDVMTDVLKDLQISGKLTFLSRIEITSGICKAVTKTVLELLECGYLHGKVGLEKVENPKKRADLELIIKSYKEWKEKNQYIDHSDVIQMALDVLENEKTEFAGGYILENCEFTYLEQMLLEKIEIKKPNLQQTSAPELSTECVSFFSAYGDYNEAKHIFRIIFEKKIPFDEVLIVVPSADPYSQVFYQIMQQYTYENESLADKSQFPITFGTGLPLLLSSPARLLMLLLDWIGSGYRSHELINIFSSGIFDINADQKDEAGQLPENEKRFTRLGVVNAIKNAMLTWQRDSYLPCFEKYLAYQTGKKEKNEKTIIAVTWLINFSKEVFEKIPEVDETGYIDVEELLGGLKSLVNKYKRIFSAFDGQGLTATLYELSTTIKGRRAPIFDAVEIIKEHMKDIKILCESPMPGKMHLTTYRQASWIERKFVFVMGLGAGNFPGLAIEDPLLLDCERPDHMLSSTDRINKNIHVMNELIQDVSGEMTCSYSDFDTIENRECYAAVVFHQIKGQFPDEKVQHVDFVLEEQMPYLDENDFWIQKGVKNGAIVKGHEWIGISDQEFYSKPVWEADDRADDTILSASSISDYLKCKYLYFLKHVLQLKQIKEDEFDELGWLSHIEIGNIYHKIFEDFILHIKENGELLDDEQAAIAYIHDIAMAEIQRNEKELPTASDYHTERQKNEILDNAAKFVQHEIQIKSNRKPLVLEMPFGEEEPLVIELGEGRKMKAAGKIDRIDIEPDGSVHTVDYKTGSTWTYKGLKDPAVAGIDEANAQHALYYLALKTLSNKDDTGESQKIGQSQTGQSPKFKNIKSMSYRFVTAKGNYEDIPLSCDDDSESVFKAAYSDLFDQIQTGIFAPEPGKVQKSEDDKVNCNYCAYSQACKYASTGEE